LIFRIIEGQIWPTRENAGTKLMIHSEEKFGLMATVI